MALNLIFVYLVKIAKRACEH